MIRASRATAFLFAALAAVMTVLHVSLIDRPNLSLQLGLHHEIVTHTAPAPYQYRILQPLLVEGLVRATSFLPAGLEKFVFLGGYAAVRAACVLVTLWCTLLALRSSFSPAAAMSGCLLLAAFLPFTYQYYSYQPTSIMELAGFALALLVTVRRRVDLLWPVVLLGAVNRETAIFGVLVYCLYWLPELNRRERLHLVGIGLGWLAIFAGLRLLFPAEGSLLSPRAFVKANLAARGGNIKLLLMLSPLFLLPFAGGLRAAHARLAMFAVPWTALHFFTSQWWEVRYYMPALLCGCPALVELLERGGRAGEGRRARRRYGSDSLISLAEESSPGGAPTRSPAFGPGAPTRFATPRSVPDCPGTRAPARSPVTGGGASSPRVPRTARPRPSYPRANSAVRPPRARVQRTPRGHAPCTTGGPVGEPASRGSPLPSGG